MPLLRPRYALVSSLALLVTLWAYGWLESPRSWQQLHEHDRSSGNVPSGVFQEKCGSEWDQIVASQEIRWYPCYRDRGPRFECSRLLVPLNHSEPEGAQAAIALARIPSPLSHHPSYRGPILLNPGGPGGSGVSLLLRSGDHFSTILGPQYDILGFDPRGVARSTPTASFFDSQFERALWENGDASRQGLHVVDVESREGIAKAWARANVIGKLASKRMDVLKHINTEQTVRDMLKIVQAHGREKLNFWGLSYGSVLGSVFATMFPDKVERIVVDGIVDIKDYFRTERRLTSLTDTHKTLSHFFTSCHAAGPSSCAFWDSSPAKIEEKLDALFAAVRKRPVPVMDNSSDNEPFYGIIDYPFLRWTVFMSLYTPFASFGPLAEALADLLITVDENRTTNGTAFPDLSGGLKLWNMFQGSALGCSDACSCSDEDTPPSRPKNENPTYKDSEITISCNDGEPVSPTLEDLEKFYGKAVTVGPDLGGEEWTGKDWVGTWATMRADCTAWPNVPKPKISVGTNSSAPLLIIGNTADPVTPLSLAKELQTSFPGSVLLTQDGPGHTSMTAPSLCKAQHVRAYFDSGKLPKSGTICPVDGDLIPRRPKANTGKSQVEFGVQSVDRGTKEMMEAVVGLSKYVTFS